MMAFIGRALRRGRDYVKLLYADYSTVLTGAVQSARQRPQRAAVIAAGVCAVCAAVEQNPDEQDYLDAIRHRQTMMATVPKTSRNEDAARLLQRLGTLQARSQIYRINCIVASIFVEARCSDTDCTYASNNSFLRPRYREYLTTRLLDVGAFGHFYRLTTAFDWQYDVPYSDFNAKHELPQFVDFIK